MSVAIGVQMTGDPAARRRHGPTLTAILAGTALLAAAAPAAALVLPAPSLKVIVNAGFNPPTTTTSNGPGGLSGSDSANGATVSATIQVSPGVALTSTLTSGTAFASGGSAQGLLTYDFAVTGPTNLVVPIHMIADLNAVTSIGSGVSFDSSAANGLASLAVFGGGVNRIWSINAASGPSVSLPSSQDLALDELLMVSSNIGVQVKESAYASGRYTATVTTTADPFFFIDPDFLIDHPGYELIFSSGIGNLDPRDPGAGGVPEPASWALMLGGFFALGEMLRRRTPTGARA